MAVMKCRLKDGKVEVLHVEKFQPGDELRLEEPTRLSDHEKPRDCLIVKKPFAVGQRFGKGDVDPCPST